MKEGKQWALESGVGSSEHYENEILRECGCLSYFFILENHQKMTHEVIILKFPKRAQAEGSSHYCQCWRTVDISNWWPTWSVGPEETADGKKKFPWNHLLP